MEMLRNVTPEVAEFLANKGKIKVLKPSNGGHSNAPVDPNFREIFGEVFFCENRPVKGSFSGRDHLRQRSQKIGWTKKVRTNMGKTIQHREHSRMLREGKINVGAGLMEVPMLKTGTEG